MLPEADCIDEDVLVAFVEGNLAGGESAALQAHFDRCSECRLLLVEYAKTVSRSTVSKLDGALSFALTAPLEAGQAVRRYVILDRVGAGSMGVVYAAYDSKLDRRVALKVLHPPPTDYKRLDGVSGEPDGERDFHARLLREAHALARVSHPNVVAIHDVDLLDRQVYIAMEFVQGQTLARWLAERQRSWNEILDIFLQAGRGLSAAHQAGLVHRDFKPDNVLIGEDGRVRVTDFGLARLLDATDEGRPEGARANTSSIHTRSSLLIGTPAYMAPEQISGAAADARSDQFSYCVALFEALYRQHPFEGRTVEELRESAVAGKIREPSPMVGPKRIQRVLRKGLSPDPKGRFGSMEELLDRLSRQLAVRQKQGLAVLGICALIAAAGVGYQGWSSRQKAICRGGERRLGAIWDDHRATAIHAAFTATGLPFAETTFSAAKNSIETYARDWATMYTAACEATRLRGEQSEELLDRRLSCLDERLYALTALVQQLERADNETVRRAMQGVGSLPLVRNCADLDALRSALPLRPEPRIREEIENQRKALALAKAKLLAHDFSGGHEAARRVLESSERINYPPLKAEALHQLGWAEFELGQYRQATESWINAIMFAQSSRHDEAAAKAAISLMNVLGVYLERFNEAEVWQRFAKSTVERLGQRDDLMAFFLSNSSLLEFSRGNFEKSLESSTRAVEFAQRAYGIQHYELARIFFSKGISLGELGRLDESLEALQAALKINESTLGPEHPETIIALDNLGETWWRKGDFDKSLELRSRAFALLEKSGELNNPRFALAMNNLAGMYRVLGDSTRALHYADRALKVRLRTVGSGSIGLAPYYTQYGNALASSGRFTEALTQHRTAVALEGRGQRGNCYVLAEGLRGVGEDWLGLHQPKRAVEALQRALACHQSHPVDPFALAETRFLLARSLWESSGDRQRARELAEAARTDWEKTSLRDAKVPAIDSWLKTH